MRTTNPRIDSGVVDELDGLLEQIAVFQMPVDLGVKTVDSANING